MKFTSADLMNAAHLKDALSSSLLNCKTVQEAGEYLFLKEESIERAGRVLAALGMTAPVEGLTEQEQAACCLLDTLGEEAFFSLITVAFTPAARKSILVGVAGLIVKGVIDADTEPCRGD